MAMIQERWDKLPITERTEIAEAAGLEGRIGSSTWEKLHQMDKVGLIEWSERDKLVEDKKSGEITKTENRFVEDDPEMITIDPEVITDEALERVAPVQDYLLWVGYGSYPTIKDFLREVDTQGVCRRVSKIPNSLKLNESKIFLAHDEGETGDAVIFAYFVPTAVEVVVYRNSNGIPDDLKAIATPVTIENAAKEQERGCGFREDIGAIYLCEVGLAVLEPYRDYNAIIHPKAKRFRGMKKVNADKILNGRTKTTPSERHKIKRSERMNRKKGQPWTGDERTKLIDLIEKHGTWRGIREMRKVNGRTLHSISYQWCKIKKTRGGDSSEEGDNE